MEPCNDCPSLSCAPGWCWEASPWRWLAAPTPLPRARRPPPMDRPLAEPAARRCTAAGRAARCTRPPAPAARGRGVAVRTRAAGGRGDGDGRAGPQHPGPATRCQRSAGPGRPAMGQRRLAMAGLWPGGDGGRGRRRARAGRQPAPRPHAGRHGGGRLGPAPARPRAGAAIPGAARRPLRAATGVANCAHGPHPDRPRREHGPDGPGSVAIRPDGAAGGWRRPCAAPPGRANALAGKSGVKSGDSASGSCASRYQIRCTSRCRGPDPGAAPA